MKERMYCLPLRENVSAKVIGVKKTKRGYMLQGEYKHKGKTLNLSKVCNKAKADEVAKKLGITIAPYKAKEEPKKAKVAAAEEDPVEEVAEEEVDITEPNKDVEDPVEEDEADQKVKEIAEEIADLKKEGKDEDSQVIKDLEKEKEYFVEVKVSHAEESLATEEEAAPAEEPSVEAVEATEVVETPEMEPVIPEVEQYPTGSGQVIGSYGPLADFAPSMHAETDDGMEEFELDYKLFDRVRSHHDWVNLKQFAKIHFEDGGVVNVSVPHFEVDHFLDLVLEAQDFPTITDPETGEEDFIAFLDRYNSENAEEKSTGISKNTLALGGTMIAGLAIGLAWWNSRRKGE